MGKSDEENLDVDTNVLVGYVRRSKACGALKVSINAAAIDSCETYTTSDGQTYVPLVISMSGLNRVLAGEREVTTISQLNN